MEGRPCPNPMKMPSTCCKAAGNNSNERPTGCGWPHGDHGGIWQPYCTQYWNGCCKIGPSLGETTGAAKAGSRVGLRTLANGRAAELAGNATKGTQLQRNKVAGDAFEQKVKGSFQGSQTGVVEQVTVKNQRGVRTRIDFLGRDSSGAIRCTECKASATAPLTKN